MSTTVHSMVYRDNLSSEQAIGIFDKEGAHWEDAKDGSASYFVSNETGEHLAAVWDSSVFWTWRIGGYNNSSMSITTAKRRVETVFTHK